MLQHDLYVHVNTLGILMFARLYQTAQFVRNHSGIYSQQNLFLGALHGVRVQDPVFSLKYLMKAHPVTTITLLTALCTVVTAVSLNICERPGPSGIQTYADAFWCTLITMSTVGYGDISPETAGGRVVILIGGVIGGALLMTMITAVFIDWVALNPVEDSVTTLFESSVWDKKMRSAGAKMLQVRVCVCVGEGRPYVSHSSHGAVAGLRVTSLPVLALPLSCSLAHALFSLPFRLFLFSLSHTHTHTQRSYRLKLFRMRLKRRRKVTGRITLNVAFLQKLDFLENQVLDGQNDLRTIRRGEPAHEMGNEIQDLKEQNDLVLRMLGAMHEQITAISLQQARMVANGSPSPAAASLDAKAMNPREEELLRQQRLFSNEIRVRPKSSRHKARRTSRWAAALGGR